MKGKELADSHKHIRMKTEVVIPRMIFPFVFFDGDVLIYLTVSLQQQKYALASPTLQV